MLPGRNASITPLTGLNTAFFGAWNGVAALALRRDALAVPPERVELAVIEAGLALLDGLIPE